MAVTEFDICNRALRRVRGSVISSFDDNTTESNVCGSEYRLLVESILSEYDWSFARKRVALDHLAEVPATGWDDYWQLPADLLTVRGIFLENGPPIIFERDQDKIACDYDESHTLICVYTASFAESYWPAYFTEVITEAMEVVLWQAVAADPDMAETRRKHLHQVTMPKARNRDYAQQTARQFPPSRLNAVRRL